MSPATRMVGAMICLVGLAASRPGAAPKFSDWAPPTNLGPAINSPFGEVGPAISKDGLSLYFSSDRPGGFGGHGDIPDLRRDLEYTARLRRSSAHCKGRTSAVACVADR